MLAKWMAEYAKHLLFAQKKWEASLQQQKKEYIYMWHNIFYQNLSEAAHCYVMKYNLLLISAMLPASATVS